VTGYYTALFDALGWANALDNRLRRDLSGEWFTEIEGAESIPRIRWARNAVHHQWDEAVYLDEKRTGYHRARSTSTGIGPTISGDKRDKPGRASYAEHLADRVELITLTQLMPVFAQAALVIADRDH
jgi:hypothetical protein